VIVKEFLRHEWVWENLIDFNVVQDILKIEKMLDYIKKLN
jgi:hypothetical protein